MRPPQRVVEGENEKVEALTVSGMVVTDGADKELKKITQHKAKELRRSRGGVNVNPGLDEFS